MKPAAEVRLLAAQGIEPTSMVISSQSLPKTSDGSGSKFLPMLGGVSFLLFGLGRVSHLWFVYAKFTLKILKKISLQVKKISSVWVKDGSAF